MTIPPTKRREYYERTLKAYQPGASKPAFSFSCNLLWRFMGEDYPEIKHSTAPAYQLVRDYLPEYYDVLFSAIGSVNPKDGRNLIGSWPVGLDGNIKRCEALAEAIKRVSLLINENTCSSQTPRAGTLF